MKINEIYVGDIPPMRGVEKSIIELFYFPYRLVHAYTGNSKTEKVRKHLT